MTPKSLNLSVVITAHNEGLIAHKTLLSIQAALVKLPSSITYEIIISVDTGDDQTKSYFSRYASDSRYRVLEVNFKGLSESRNFAVSVARGRYIAFLDADDLVSSTWLQEGYRIASTTNNCVVHPEYSITFGDDNLIWQKRDSHDITHDSLCLIDNNLWDSPSLASWDIFRAHPYHPNGNGYGYEDKHFNCSTLAAGIKHVVAPQTILFVRRKVTGSMLMQGIADRVTMAPSELLSFDAILGLDIRDSLTPQQAQGAKHSALKQHARQTAKHAVLAVHRRAKKYALYSQLTAPLREKRQISIDRQLKEKYPSWMIREWRQIHKIDNQIFPAKDLLKTLPWYNAENINPGLHYAQLVQSFSHQPDTLFFVPWLIKGGADMLFINYSNELAKLHSEWQIAVLQTEQKDSIWQEKLSKGIDFINLFEIFHGLDIDTQQRLLATFTTQVGIKRIIIGNSQLAYDFVSRHETLLRRLDIAIYCYAFGEEFDDEGRLWGHIHTGIPRIYPSIHRIITDNENTVNKLEREYAFDRNRFSVHYQPTSVTVQSPSIGSNKDKLKVLWASRVCKQKRPDILKAISNQLDPNIFTIDAYGQLEEGLTPDYFADSQVNYKGVFNGAASLPTSEYDIFLYTSEGDGVPNILQEMTAAGLPIVASNVGGIREIIMTGKSGCLIEDHEKIEDYVSALGQLRDPAVRLHLVTGAQELLATRFSRQVWEANILHDFDR